MTPGLRDHKGASLRIAVPDAVPEDMRERIREIVSLSSSNPRKGYATTLMWSVCHEADKAGFVLMLQPIPFDDATDAEKLKRFYGKFGFVEIQQEPVVLMARQPKNAPVIARAA